MKRWGGKSRSARARAQTYAHTHSHTEREREGGSREAGDSEAPALLLNDAEHFCRLLDVVLLDRLVQVDARAVHQELDRARVQVPLVLQRGNGGSGAGGGRGGGRG